MSYFTFQKKINNYLFLLAFIVYLIPNSKIYAQNHCPSGGAVFVNEIYNQSGSVMEYVELVVVGDPADPTAPVDLSGWIVDDNNVNQGGQGTAQGHLILGSNFSSVKPGAIILIYNESNPYPNLPSSTPPFLYVVAGNQIEGCKDIPKFNNPAYTPCGNPTAEFNSVGMRNAGDIMQTRYPNLNSYHAIGYGNPQVMPDVQTNLAEVSGNSIGLDCGDWFDGSNYTITSQTPGEPNSTENGNLINAIRNGTLDCDDINKACDPPCPIITAISILPDEICENNPFVVTATGLGNMSSSLNGAEDYGIGFYYYSGSNPPADPYSGGSLLGTVSNTELTGVNPEQVATLSVLNNPLSAGTYNICAVIDPTPDNPDCKVYQCTEVIVKEVPTASLTGDLEFCPGDCHTINVSISGGSNPYIAEFTFSISGLVDFPFIIPAYDINNQLKICYSGDNDIPWYEDNTLIIPTWVTGSGSLTLTSLTSNGCPASVIEPNDITLTFKEKIELDEITPVEKIICDEEGDGEYVDLTDFDSDIIIESTQTIIWFEDENCNVLITDPTSYYISQTTTVYAKISEVAKCNSDSIPVILELIEAPFEGSGENKDVCNTNSCANLYSLNGGADIGGYWNDDDGAGVNLSDGSCVDFTGVAVGSYEFTYTIQDVDGLCPKQTSILTINVVEPPDPGNNAIESICNTETCVNFNDLNGITTNLGTWSDNSSSGVSIGDGSCVNFTDVAAGSYQFTYTVQDAEGLCTPQTSVLTINVLASPNAGNDATKGICNTATCVNFNDISGISVPLGTWSDDDNSQIVIGTGNCVNFTGVSAGTYRFTYTATDPTGQCPDASSTLTITVSEAPFAGQNNTEAICNDNSCVDLITLANNPDAGGSWNDDNGAGVDLSDPTCVDFTSLSENTYHFTYTIQDPSGQCGDGKATIAIEVYEPAFAGNDGTSTICNTENCLNFFALNGNPDAGGSWSDDDGSGANVSNGNCVDFTNIGAGTYRFTYTVQDINGLCPAQTSTLTIEVLEQGNPGQNGGETFCGAPQNAVDLESYLGANFDNNGTWVNSDGFDISNPNAVDMSTAAEGIYQFKYQIQNPPCDMVEAVVVIQITSTLFAGDDNEESICNLEDCVNLINLNGNPNVGGIWSNDDNAQVSLFNPLCVDFSNVSAGTYHFTYTITDLTAQCPEASSTLTITVSEAPFAGQNNTEAICNDNSCVDLITLASNPDAGGSWSDDDGAGVDLSDPTCVNFTSLPENTYHFTYTIQDPSGQCQDSKATVTIEVSKPPFAGNNGTSTICNTENCLNLFDLNGNPTTGGSWSDDSNTGLNLSDGSCVDFSSIAAGTYNFTYTVQDINGLCPAQSSTLTIEVLEPGNPGESKDVAFCGTPQNPVDLESYLGANFDNNGTWVNGDGFDISNPNAVDMSAAGEGTYEFRYQIQNAPCDMVEAVVTIEITSTLFAGDGNEESICNLEDCVNLINLNGNPNLGGTWNDDDNSQVDLNDPTCVDFKNVPAGTYHFTYTITDPLGQCDEASSILTINVSEPPYAGQSNTDSICNTTSCFDLVSFAGNPDVGGYWSDDDGSGVNLSNPNCIDFTSTSKGKYNFTYTIEDPSGQCDENQATITIEVFETPFGGIDSTVTICNTEKCVNLHQLNGNPTEGGSWNDDNATGINLSDGKCVDFTNIGEGTYKFTYTVQDISGKCDAQQSTLTINIESTPNAGSDNSKNICIGDASPINLPELIGSHKEGGNWKQESGTPIGTFEPTSLELKDQPVGSYSFLYTVSNDCGIDSAFVYIDISTAPSAGTYHDYTICENEIVNLFDSLFDNNVGGLWYDENGTLVGEPTSVTLNEIKTYTFKYVIPENGTCEADSSYAKITTIKAPYAGIDTTLVFCEGGTEKIDLVSQLQPDEGVDHIFKDLNGTGALNSASGEIDISLLSESDNSYVFQLIVGEGTLCGADTSNLNINIVKTKNAGSDYSLTICNDESDIDIDNLLGTHDPGGTWTNLNNADVNLQNPKSVSFYGVAAGTYKFEYKFEATSSCPEASATVEIIVNPATDFAYNESLCAGQEITIAGNVYTVDNPTDTLYLTNVFGCDSIVYINISEKIMDYKVKAIQQNCFGNGGLLFEEFSGGALPLKVKIDENKDYNIDEIPSSINDLSSGTHTYDIIDNDGCVVAQSEEFEIKEFEGYSIDVTYNSFEGYYQINVETNMDYETVSWSPAQGLSCTDCLNPKARPDKNQIYEVTLTDKEGCTVTGTVSLSPIMVIEIDVPNVFSPNGDGYNDVFFANGNTDILYSMHIYDRWGENIFFAENLKLNDATDAWDGTFKGEKLNTGVYVYVIEYEIEENKPQVISGDVLLLR